MKGSYSSTFTTMLLPNLCLAQIVSHTIPNGWIKCTAEGVAFLEQLGL